MSRSSEPERAFVEAQERALRRYGVDAESRLVEVDAVHGSAHVLVAGTGPPVMMVIGGGLPAAMWAPLMGRLGGFTRYAVDLPGLGLTSPTTFDPATFRAFSVEFLDQVLQALGLERAVLVGQSIGGLWSTWLARDRPQHVSRLALIGCPAAMLGTSAPLGLRMLTVPGVAAMLSRLQPPSTRQVERVARMGGEDLSGRSELRDLLEAAERLPTWTPSLVRIVRAVVGLRGARSEVVLTADELAAVSRPVQLIWGEHDPFGPPSVGARAAQLIPSAHLHVVAGGHGPWFGQAGPIAELATPFLAGAAASTTG